MLRPLVVSSMGMRGILWLPPTVISSPLGRGFRGLCRKGRFRAAKAQRSTGTEEALKSTADSVKTLLPLRRCLRLSLYQMPAMGSSLVRLEWGRGRQHALKKLS